MVFYILLSGTTIIFLES